MNEDALAQALQDALTENANNRNGFKTSRELMEQTGYTLKEVLRRLHRLDDQGRLEADNVLIKNISGRGQSVPAYRLVTAVDVQSP